MVCLAVEFAHEYLYEEFCFIYSEKGLNKIAKVIFGCITILKIFFLHEY